MNDKNFYITTALPYMNARLHIGHAYEFVLADIIARYHRLHGDRTFFLTGADEHGDKIVRAAQKENYGPQAFVNKNVESFKELLEALNISNDGFIRTSDKEHHWSGARKLWRAMEESGDIYKGTYRGLYCVGCEAFITEKELVNGKCPLHDAMPEEIQEENYFFKLSKYGPELARLLKNGDFKVSPASKVNEILGLISGGSGESALADVSISRPEREIPWGIPVPHEPAQLMYVWCDALSNYISALGYGSDDEEKFRIFWPANVQVIGKDIMRFHALLWPAFLLSAKLPLPRELLIHGFITSGGKKMSKTIGNVLNPEEFIAEYGTDALRYYFAREISPTEDGDLTREKFKEVYNANLANGLGNLVSRTLKMAEQYFGGVVTGDATRVPPIDSKVTAVDTLGDIAGMNIPYIITNDILPRYHEHMQRNEINKAADVIWELIGHLDQFITDYEPFKLVKTDRLAAEAIIWGLLYGLRDVGMMLAPMMPKTAEKIALLIGFYDVNVDGIVFNAVPPKEPLFMRKE
ncbi:MAG: methionine--tRNA ligase [Minisyncoccia bacterium]